MGENLPCWKRRLDVANVCLARPDNANSDDGDWPGLGPVRVNGSVAPRENQHGIVAAKAEGVAHHMREWRRLQLRHWRKPNGGIGGGEARIGRHHLPD
jgi:hypothetical protein